MKILPEGLLITNDSVIAFFRENPSPAIAAAFDSHVLSFVSAVTHALKQSEAEGQRERDSNHLRAIMEQFENRQAQQLESLVTSINHQVDTALRKTTLADSISEKIEVLLKQQTSDRKLETSELKQVITTQLQTGIVTPLETIKAQISDMPDRVERGVSSKIDVLKEQSRTVKSDVEFLLKSHIGTIQGSETARSDLKEFMTKTFHSIDKRFDEVTGLVDSKVGGISSSQDILRDKLEAMERTNSRTATCSKLRGTRAEIEWFEILQDHLKERDGFTISRIETDRGCDILLQRDGYTDIRLEIKSFTAPVTSPNVAKFLRDIDLCGSHGIFLSTSTPIVGKSSFMDFEQRPKGHLAFYLASVETNVQVVLDTIYIIHQLDRVITRNKEEAGTLLLGPDTIHAIKRRLTDCGDSICKIKDALQSSLALLRNMESTITQDIIKLVTGAALDEDKHVSPKKKGRPRKTAAVPTI